MDGLGLLRAANVSVWVEAFGALGRAPDPDLIGGVRLASPTATSHAAEITHLSSVGLRDAETAYLTMLVSDAQRAASRLRPRYDETGGEDGLVELARLPGAASDAS